MLMMKYATLNDVIEHFGGVPKLAKALGIEPQAIYQWKGLIPLGRAYQIESISGGVFSAADMETKKSRKVAA